MSGYPLRNSFKRDYPEYNPFGFKTDQLINNDEADVLVWISSFKPIAPILSKKPTIVIGHPNTQFTQQPDVFIPVCIPGFQQKGLMFRMDSSVILPLKQILDSTLPTLSYVCAQMMVALNTENEANIKTSADLKAGKKV